MTTLLQTDAYKFSMAQSGFPLREETFYLSFRKGGWQHVPFDLETEARSLLATALAEPERRYLASAGYGVSGGMEAALGDSRITVRAVPQGSWVYQREPILSVTAASFMASWLEPTLLRLSFPIQLATEIHRSGAKIDPAMLHATCDAQAEIMKKVIHAVGRDVSSLLKMIVVDEGAYRECVGNVATRLIEVTKDPDRIFEVGMRAATCERQHEICLEVLRDKGIHATSNVSLARSLDMRAVGTMGHEHVQRWGDDLPAFRAIRDMRHGTPSYLLDTFDTIVSGIPAAIAVAKERPHKFCIRYDSGDKYAQYLYAHGAFGREGLAPIHIIEDGLDAETTARFEQLREFTGVAPARQIYGYGGYLVSRSWRNPLTRDKVAAVYKLSSTCGEPRMKFGNEGGLGKVSIPGDPVAWRRLRGDGPLSVIGQHGETPPEDYVVLSGNDAAAEQLRICNVDGVIAKNPAVPHQLSPRTRALAHELRIEHEPCQSSPSRT